LGKSALKAVGGQNRLSVDRIRNQNLIGRLTHFTFKAKVESLHKVGGVIGVDFQMDITGITRINSPNISAVKTA
jgi:hypothetical protein